MYILFDLDGTLTDPKAGITKSIEYALKHFNINVPNLDDLCKFIGPPLRYSFKEYYGLNEDEVTTAIAKYRERFSSVGLYENEVYLGVHEMLERLKSLGNTLIIATSKPKVYAVQILEHFDLMKYFSYVAGSELDGTRDNKDEVIAYALSENKIENLENIVMIGDRKHDILGAKKCKLKSIGVLYGFGDKEELQKAEADFIVSNVEELEKTILQLG